MGQVDTLKTIGLGMAVYNRDRYLEGAIDSVLRQTFQDWELHIVDDCSNDKSLTIAIDYASRDSRIKVHSHYPNRGAGFTLRSALALCNSKYLGWLDSDDELDPTALDTMVKYLSNHPEVGMAYSQYSTMNADGQCTGIGRRCSIPYSPDRLLVDFMTFHLRVIRSEAYHSIGGINPGLRAAVDYDFCLRVSEVMGIQCVPEILYRYREHPDSISMRDRGVQIEYSRRAIEQALVRRGLAETHRLEVKTVFRLERIR